MKENKTLVRLALAVGAVIGGYLFYRTVRKSYKELTNREKVNQTILEKNGLTQEDMEPYQEPVTGEPENFVKKLYTEVRFESNLEVDCVNTDLIYSNPVSERVVHIKMGKRGHRDTLDFLFEIPLAAYGGREFSNLSPSVPDFLNAILGETVEESDIAGGSRKFRKGGLASDLHKLLVVSEQPYTQLEGYYFLTFKRKDEEPDYPRCSGMVKIQESFYRDLAEDGKNPLSKYVAKVRKELNTSESTTLQCDSDDIEDVKIEDVILVQKVSFPIATESRPDGVTIKTALRCLEYILDEFKVIGRKAGTKFEYEYFLFYDPDSYDDVCCYDTVPAAGGKVKVISSPVFGISNDTEEKK